VVQIWSRNARNFEPTKPAWSVWILELLTCATVAGSLRVGVVGGGWCGWGGACKLGLELVLDLGSLLLVRLPSIHLHTGTAIFLSESFNESYYTVGPH